MMSWRLPLAVVSVLVLVVALTAGCRPQGGGTADLAPGEQPESHAETPAETPGHSHDNETATEPETTDTAGQTSPGEAKQILESGDIRSQTTAVEALSSAIKMLEPAEAKEALRELGQVALDRERPIELRTSAVSGIASGLREYEEARTLLRQLAAEPDSQMRERVAESLEHSGGDPAAMELADRLAQDKDPIVRATAIRVRTILQAAGPKGDQMRQLVAALGMSEGDASAQAAIQIIIKGGEDPKTVLAPLINALSTSTDARQRHAVAMCLALVCAGENPQQQKFGRLARATKKTPVRLHPAVLEGVGPLIKALQDKDALVREVAAQGLGYLGDARAAKPLGRALSDPSPSVRRRAASALVTVPARDAQADLEKAVRSDPDPNVRRYAVEALGWMEDESVIPTLVVAASDRDSRVRRFAAQELGRRGAREALAALMPLFQDPDEDVRWQAVLAVGKMRDKSATDALVKALDDPAPQVANAAERALQRLGIARRSEKYLEEG